MLGAPDPSEVAARQVTKSAKHWTKEFVQNALRKIFDLSESAAERLMLEVHQSGAASLGTMDVEDAREKISRTLADARANDFPLKFALK